MNGDDEGNDILRRGDGQSEQGTNEIAAHIQGRSAHLSTSSPVMTMLFCEVIAIVCPTAPTNMKGFWVEK